ncbi:MAG: TlpA family protein disulfide reductase [Mucilaginibacter polytrichastri]|nr:TlpA family protein disulfide reductase [Mucilaginibacter polytrichastri]
MRRIVLFWVLSLCSVTAFSVGRFPVDSGKTDDRGYHVRVGDQLPAGLKLRLTDGRTVALDELRGKTILLQFTASWCVVCRREMPHLEKEIWQAYKNKDFLLIGVDRDEPLEKVEAFQKAMDISYPLALDPGAEIFAKFADKKAGVTRNVLIGPDGKIVFLTRLYDEQEFSALVKKVGETVTDKTTHTENSTR